MRVQYTDEPNQSWIGGLGGGGEGKMESSSPPKGKRERSAPHKGERENAGNNFRDPVPLGNQTARTHAGTHAQHDTKRFPSWTHPPTSDLVFPECSQTRFKMGPKRKGDIIFALRISSSAGLFDSEIPR